MSFTDSFINILTSPLSSSGSSTTPPEQTAGARRRRHEFRRRRDGDDGSDIVEKQEIDRRAETYGLLEDAVVDESGIAKPYDPIFLRDIASNAVVQAYVDTLSQDAASASWQIKPRDSDMQDSFSDKELSEAERTVRSLHPELPFRDVLAGTSRILLEFGDSCWVKHYFENSDDLAEILLVDSATMFKKVNDHGITQGYMQASRRSQDVTAEFDIDEVVWFSWSPRPDRHYGEGPLEKTRHEVELIEELQTKERLDLIAGSPPGVVSPDFTDEFGTVPDEDWDTFVEGMQLDEGERHRVGYSKVPIDFTPITPSYQELQILERTKYWVTVLGSVFKVNPSYAGFDFENTNRATDTSQQEAYAQRGFRVLLRQLEESINRGLIWSDISEDLKFEFEREQTVAERKDRAELIESQADAARAIAGAVDEDADDPDGKVQYRDGRIVVEDGEVVPEDDGGDAGGGLFMSTDDGDVTKEIPEAVLSEISEDRFIPPKGAKEACERALELIDEHGRETASGGTQEALQRARQIIRHYEDDDPLIGTNDDGVPYVVEIANFHRRHRAQGNHEFDDDDHDHRYEDNGWLSDQLWGSDAGFEWSDSLADRIDEVRESLSLSTEWDLYDPADGGDTGNGDGGDGTTDGTVVLSDDELVDFDRHLLTAHKEQIQPASVDDIEKRTWNRDDVVPEYVRDAVNEAVDRGAVFERFESVPTDLRDRVEDIVQESLTQPQGWSLDSIVDRMQDVFPGADADDLETVARTETTSVLNRARETGYENRDDSDRFVYYWQGPGDSRTTALCEDLKIATGQESGTPDTDFDFVPGEPVDMKTLVRLEREASENHFPNLQYRRHTPHINCRHTFVRDTTADTDIDVTVPDAEVFNSVGKCGCVDDAGDTESYRDTVSKLADDLARSDRERQIERALGESIVQALRTAFTESGGSVEPAKRHLNNRLTRSSSYDDDEHGLVSKPTLYNWKRKYDDRLNDVL